MSTTIEDEARAFADRKLAELSALSWEELDRYEARAETVTLGSGRSFKVKSLAYWTRGNPTCRSA